MREKKLKKKALLQFIQSDEFTHVPEKKTSRKRSHSKSLERHVHQRFIRFVDQTGGIGDDSYVFIPFDEGKDITFGNIFKKFEKVKVEEYCMELKHKRIIDFRYCTNDKWQNCIYPPTDLRRHHVAGCCECIRAKNFDFKDWNFKTQSIIARTFCIGG